MYASIFLVGMWVVFFVIQVAGGALRTEKNLATIALIMVGIFLISGPPLHEVILLFIGIALGLLIEVGLGLILRQQHWDQASLYGVPLWLPLIWGYGFVTIGRLSDALQFAVSKL